VLPLHAAPAGVALLTEIRGRLPGLLRRQVGRKPLAAADLNLALVPPMWRRAVLDNPQLDGAADHDAYVTTVSLPGVPWGECHDTEHAGQAVPSGGTTVYPGLGDIRARIALD
jgi:hypothetical protein